MSKGIGEKVAEFGKAVFDKAVMPAMEKLIPQGAAEVAQALFTGNGYVPYGPTEQPVPMDGHEQAGHGVHGPQGVESPADNVIDFAAARDAAQVSLADRAFVEAAQVERSSHDIRTPGEREAVLDGWQERAGAVREACAERGDTPPMFSVLNREEMREVFTPDPSEPRLFEGSPDVSGQGVKERFLSQGRDPNWRDHEPEIDDRSQGFGR